MILLGIQQPLQFLNELDQVYLGDKSTSKNGFSNLALNRYIFFAQSGEGNSMRMTPNVLLPLAGKLVGFAVCPQKLPGKNKTAVLVRLKKLSASGWKVHLVDDYYVATKLLSESELADWPPTSDLLNDFQFLLFSGAEDTFKFEDLFPAGELAKFYQRTAFTPSVELLQNLEKHSVGIIFNPAFEFRRRALTWITPKHLNIVEFRRHFQISRIFSGPNAHEVLTYTF